MVADVLKVYFSSDLLVVRSMMDISFEHKASGKLKALINFTSKLLFSSILNGNFSVGNDHSAKLPRHPCFLLPAAPLLHFSQPVQVFHFPFRVYMKHFLLHKPHWGKGQRRVWGPAVLLCSSSGWRFLLPRSDSWERAKTFFSHKLNGKAGGCIGSSSRCKGKMRSAHRRRRTGEQIAPSVSTALDRVLALPRSWGTWLGSATAQGWDDVSSAGCWWKETRCCLSDSVGFCLSSAWFK